MEIRNLRSNHLENPFGFFMDELMVSWTVGQSTGLRQAAARVVVSLSENFDEPLFDSGRSEDISSLGYVVEIELKPCTRYYWRVEVWADDGDHAVSETAWFETAKMDEAWQAKWIAAPFDKEVHPIIVRDFDLDECPVRARVYATGLGVYELSLNGDKAGDEYLAPYYNDYNLWVQYQTYDVTSMLHAGKNRISFMLGNGWYKGRFGFVPEMRELYGDQMKLLAELHLEFADGREIVIRSDENWQCKPSPVLESSIYDGEVYDARLECPWDDVDGFESAIPAEAPKGDVVARRSPPLRVIRQMKPEKLLITPAGEQVIDFGQVMTGWVEFDCDLPAGAQVYLQCGELLQHDNFYRENLRTAKEEYTYISAGRPAHVRPYFTFYGFRYMKVTGIEEVRLEDFEGYVLCSDLEETGHIETSNPKVNRLILNALWSQRGNFVDVPTDCPQRDERMGWTGDAHVFAPTASFNMYTPAFYDKFLYDMLLEQRELDGSVPHVVPDVLDQIASLRGTPLEHHGSCAWGDAATAIPWTMYEFYGNRTLLGKQYENMCLWTDWIHQQDEDRCGGNRLWTCGFHFADWLALDNPVQGSSFGGTDPYFIASAYYYYSAITTAKAAKVLGKDEDYARYTALAEEVKAAIQREYFTSTGRIAVPTQTAMIMALNMDLVPDAYRERLKVDLKKRIEDLNWHMDTGFVGTYYLCQTLSQNGMSDIAYTLLLNEDYPSWLYEVNMGATTIWERWNSVLPNGLVSDTGMNSMNHYAYGSVVEWMYRYMAGLNPMVEKPGFKRVRITPQTDARFDWIRAEYDSAAGKYTSAWKRTEAGVEYEITVPFDCEADFVPENPDARVTFNGATTALSEGKITLCAGTHRIFCEA